MKVVIDAVPVSESLRAGIAYYSTNLLRHLAAVDPKNEYIIFGSTRTAAELGITNSKFTFKRIPPVFRFPSFWYYWTTWYYVGFPFQLLGAKPDVFLSMQPNLPFLHGWPTISVVYDITPLLVENAFSLRFRFFFSAQLGYAIRHATRIAAISRSTKNEIAQRFKLPPDKIDVIYPGYDERLFRPDYPRESIGQAVDRYGIAGKYIIYVGTLEPKKNILRLLQAFSMLVESGRIHHSLVLVGKRGLNDELIFKEIDKLRLGSRVIVTGYVTESDLPLLVSGAEAFVFPSLHEGFGIPPLEAMACGTPVITSNTASLPEVVGEAGKIVDPYNVEDVAAAIAAVLADENLRSEMRRKGLERASQFSWEKSARKMVAIFEQLNGQRRPEQR
jgi:glycosyltransferase involved in cell wall biosynthesis